MESTSTSASAKADDYLFGFGNHFATQALPGALPQGQNSPQRCPYGLYAEQISGTAFTTPRAENLRSWLYRIRPSVLHGEFVPLRQPTLARPAHASPGAGPNQLRWSPLPEPVEPCDFVEGVFTVCGCGSAASQTGLLVHLYGFNRDMEGRFFYDADGELLLVPESGAVELRTEFGMLAVAPLEIAVIPRGVKFQVRSAVSGERCRGYICENFGQCFELPNLGPIGANGLANPRDFAYPRAAYEDVMGGFELVAKYDGRLWRADLRHSPLDVVAWHGNYAPYKYDLRRFQAVNTVTFDHCDPSIFTVLTSASSRTGTANCDFVIFPPRWMVAERTFRPPWFHRNIMSEFMGLVLGRYDAKADGFVPGASSLHNCMSPHGPDAKTFAKASTETLSPRFLDDTLAFMFESRLPLKPTEQALEAPFRQTDYLGVWQSLRSNFTPDRR